MHDKTLSRRLLLVSIPAAAMMPAANAASVPRFPPSGRSTAVIESAADDPVFAAIARHSEAEREWRALSGASNEVSDAALGRAQDALLAWLKTVPTTLDGAIATLEHAAVKYGDGFDDYTNLAESAQFVRGDGGAGDVLAAGERFPAMIADVLRQLVREAVDCAV
jgi:hypothetical protein